MKFIEFRDVPVDQIAVGDRVRPLDPDWALALSRMIDADGMQSPIDIYPNGKGYKLSFGLHRLEATKLLKQKTIKAGIYEPETDNPEAESRLREIMENFGRRELSALDRAAHLAELKRIHETLYPETKRGVAGGKARQNSATDILSFADSAAEKCGLNPRSIRRAVALYEGLDPKVRDAVRGLPIADNQSQLGALSRLAPDTQAKVAEELASGRARSFGDAKAAATGNGKAKAAADQAAFEALLKIWNRAGAKARKRFLAEIGAELTGGE